MKPNDPITSENVRAVIARELHIQTRMADVPPRYHSCIPFSESAAELRDGESLARYAFDDDFTKGLRTLSADQLITIGVDERDGKAIAPEEKARIAARAELAPAVPPKVAMSADQLIAEGLREFDAAHAAG